MSRPGPESPFISDVPAADAVSAWLDACRAAGCPNAPRPDRGAGRRRARSGDRGAGVGDPLVPVERPGGDGRDRGPRRGDPRGHADHAAGAATGPVRRGGHRGPDPRRIRRRGDARARPLRGRGRRDHGRGPAVPARALDRRGRQCRRAAAAAGAPAASGRHRRGRGGRGDRCRRAPAPAGGGDPHRRRDRSGGQCDPSTARSSTPTR